MHACIFVRITDVLVYMDHQVKQECELCRAVSSKMEMNTCFSLRNLAVNVINDLVAFAICRARCYPNPQNIYLTQSVPGPLCSSLYLS